MNNQISKTLLRLGIPPSLKGFECISNAIEILLDEPTLVHEMSKKVYTAISEKMNLTVGRVERNIRYIIKIVFDEVCVYANEDKEHVIKEIFGNMGKPTNTEFLGAIAHYLRMKECDTDEG